MPNWLHSCHRDLVGSSAPSVGPTRTMLRTAPGPFAVGAPAPPAEAFALSAMAVLHFSRAGGYGSGDSRPSARGVAQLTCCSRPTFLPTAVQHKAHRVGGQACQLDHRCTVTAITG